jgi:hypothetical protein
VAVTGVLAGGVIVAALPQDHRPNDVDPTGIMVAVSTAVALVAIKRWLRQHEDRTKADVRSLAEHHTLRSEELDRRERALATRETIAARREATHALRMRSLASTLDTARAQLAEKTTALETLEAAYNVTRKDYNALVEHVLRDGYDRFVTDTEGPHKPIQPDLPRQADEHRRGTAPVTILRSREHHGSA